MTEDHTWQTGTPAQMQRANALATEWREQAQDDPIVALGAATTVLMNMIYLHVPTEYRAAMIETVHTSLRQILD